MLAPDFAWQVTCGEISIHPYKKRFLELIEGRPALFFTNGFRYDEGIAQHIDPKTPVAICPRCLIAQHDHAQHTLPLSRLSRLA